MARFQRHYTILRGPSMAFSPGEIRAEKLTLAQQADEELERFLRSPEKKGVDAVEEGMISATLPFDLDPLHQVVTTVNKESADDEFSDTEWLGLCRQVENQARTRSSMPQERALQTAERPVLEGASSVLSTDAHDDGMISATLSFHQDSLQQVVNTVCKGSAVICTEEQSRSHFAAPQKPAPQSPSKHVSEGAPSVSSTTWSPRKAFENWVPTEGKSNDEDGRRNKKPKTSEAKMRSKSHSVGSVWVSGHYRRRPSGSSR